jgi:hypothetical protein
MLAVAFFGSAYKTNKMEAKDFRIGNMVAKRLKSGNGRTITDKLGCQDIVRIFENTGSFIYEPILLNIDWLMKFGGKPLENGYWISVNNLKAELHFEVFNNTDEIVTTIKSQFSDLILDRIKYVHELQNLYFSLTKSELGES